ncbi:MAG TPA: amidase [Pirellulaceae bacterium]|nr:amidase [Pirellulaceae bacterium]HMO93621.1 amidase [Pirellulaceae bacterium]HMP70493.1 amidase [Pirellulaceae bacterium]
MHRALVSQFQDGDELVITPQMVKNAEWIAGTELSDEQRDELAKAANRTAKSLQELRNVSITFEHLPAVHFVPLVNANDQTPARRVSELSDSTPVDLPTSDDELAFLPVAKLAKLIKAGQLTSRKLTSLYLDRLKRYDPVLKCVVSLTEELALRQAARADEEIAAGRYRGPLHGIPWGAKDLMAVPGYPTTWGIPQFKDRIIDETATVAQRLEEAGAVLVAKLSLGAIAMGDQWFGGMTRNPWNPGVGSSGSSAGSACAAAAGLVGFTIGTETLGSILSPCRRCGTTGLRPTFGRVSRAGCMPLTWTMDKVGPIVRHVEDAAIVFQAIYGSDGLDPTVIDKPFTWPTKLDLSKVRVGYVKSRRDNAARPDLERLQKLGVELVEIELPSVPSITTLTDIIGIEGASVFEEMLVKNDTEGWNTWPGTFRKAQFVSALDYLRFMRIRRQLMFAMEELMQSVDVLVNANDIFVTNLTGHPSVVLPREFNEQGGWQVPISDVFTGSLFGESTLLSLALAYQNECTGHLVNPPLDEIIAKYQQQELDRQKNNSPSDKK